MATAPQQFNQNPYGIDPGAKDCAGQNYAALTRDLWAQWTTNFLPFENDLIEYASNPQVVADAQANASEQVGLAFDATHWHLATGVREHDGRVWLGSLVEPAIAWSDALVDHP